MRTTKTAISLLSWATLTLGLGSLGWASAVPAVATASPSLLDDKDDKKDEGAEEEEEEPGDEYFAVVGGDILTEGGACLRGATLLAKNGKIEEIGYDIELPEETEILNVKGLRVYPGLVAVDSSGLFGTSSDFENSIDSYGANMTLGLSAGITTAAQSQTPIKLKRFEIEDLVAGPRFLANQIWSNRNPTSKSTLRGKFAKASEYIISYREYERKKRSDKSLKEPSKKGVDGSALAILRNEALPYFTSNSRGELLEIARLAQRYGFRPVIRGCMEGWTVADELGRAGAYAIVTPRTRNDKSEALVRDGGSTIENAAILHKSGVQVSVIPSTASISLTGIAGRDLLHLPTEAAFAVRGGLSDQAALDAITIVPARIHGISHRVGSLTEGKDCDLIVTDGDVLHYETFVQYAVVEGKLVYDKEEELYFAHIRPRADEESEEVAAGDPDLAPEDRLDPGETEVEPEPEDEDEEPEDEPEKGDDDSESGEEPGEVEEEDGL